MQRLLSGFRYTGFNWCQTRNFYDCIYKCKKNRWTVLLTNDETKSNFRDIFCEKKTGYYDISFGGLVECSNYTFENKLIAFTYQNMDHKNTKREGCGEEATPAPPDPRELRESNGQVYNLSHQTSLMIIVFLISLFIY